VSILKGVYYPRPKEQYLSVPRTPSDGTCPECEGTDIKRYAAFTARGPRFVHKCQACFALVREEGPNIDEAHPPFWPMTRRWNSSRAG
jgi:hypothetical protein